MKTYTCWWSKTCWVCQKSTGNPPRIHASTRGLKTKSPCDSMSVDIKATSRKEAIRIFRERNLCPQARNWMPL